MKNTDIERNAHVTKSLDPKWVRWAVSVNGADTVWFYSENTAEAYANAIRVGDADKAAQIALDYSCQ